MTSDAPPPDAVTSDKLMRIAILLSLRREAEGADGRMITKLHLIADKLVDKAADGDTPAIKEILDRIDGKSLQGTTTDEGPATATIEWLDNASSSDTGPAGSSSPSTPGGNASPAS